MGIRIATKEFVKDLLSQVIKQVAPFRFGIEDGEYGFYKNDKFVPIGTSSGGGGGGASQFGVITFEITDPLPFSLKDTVLKGYDPLGIIKNDNILKYSEIKEVN